MELHSTPEAYAYEFHSEGGCHAVVEQVAGTVPCSFGEECQAKFRAADLVAANVQFADDRDFEAHRKRDTKARKVADEKYLGSLIESCQTKFSEFEAWQKLRVEELEVLEQAISILQNGVKPARRGNFQDHLSGAASHVDEATAGKARVLLGLGGRWSLQPTLVDARNSTADPLFKVRVFIKELIMRLKEDSAVDAEHKGWCDAELWRNG